MSTRPHKDRIRRRLVASYIAAFACLAAANVACTPLGRDDPSLWFGNLNSPADLTDEVGRQLVRYAASRLGSGDGGARLGPAARSDRRPRVVFLSVGGPAGPATVVMAGRRGLLPAIEAALEQTFTRLGRNAKCAWVKLDVVDNITPVRSFAPSPDATYGEGMTGIALRGTPHIALLPEEFPAAGLAKFEDLNPASLVGCFRRRTPAPPGPGELAVQLSGGGWHFSTKAWFCDGAEAFSLYRGRRVAADTSSAEALDAARLGAEYLKRIVRRDGRFVYEYNPVRDTISSTYNIVRHAGTIYSMMELYAVTRDAKLLEAGEKALGYLLGAVQPCGAGGEMAWVVEKNHAKLGGAALAILAMCKHAQATGSRKHLPTMRKLARWIVSVQGADGRFTVHKVYAPTGRATTFRSVYYPGEAIFALMRLHELDGRKEWLDAAYRNARYLITVRDRDVAVTELPHDHWLLYGLNELYRRKRDPILLRQAMRIAEAILKAQVREHVYPDYVGTFLLPPAAAQVAVRSEGLSAAWMLAKDFGRPEEAGRILAALRLAIALQRRMQFRPESAMYFRRPGRCIGGFGRAYGNPRIRIDYVQHNISALLGYRRVLRARNSSNGRQVPAR